MSAPPARRPGRPAAAALLLMLAVALSAAQPAGSAVAGATHVQDGLGDEWDAEDVVALSGAAPPAGAPLDLTGLLADDNETHFFAAVNYSALGGSANATLAFYFFHGTLAGAPAEPRGFAVQLPAGTDLTSAVYLDLSGPLPGSSDLTYFDGTRWQNRSLVELGIEVGRNDSVGLVELSLPRDSLLFLQAGRLAAVLFDENGTAQDALPDLSGPPARLTEAAAFYDYARHPPITFTAIGFSNPGAAEGQPVLIFLQLTNQGPKTASGVSAHVLSDGEPLGAREDLSLLPGGTAVMNFTWTAKAGLHNFTATSFPGGDQRTISAVFSGAESVLVIEDVRVEPASVYVGTDFHVLVTIRNRGEAPSGAVEVLLKNATQVISRATVPQLFPGEATNASLGGHYALPGTKTLRVEIDGVNTPDAGADLQVSVQERPMPFAVPLEALALAALVAFAVAMWFLTPRLVRERPPGR